MDGAGIDTGSARYFDDVTGAFVDADEFRLMRFAGVSQVDLAESDEVIALSGDESDGVPDEPQKQDDQKEENADKLAGKIEWDARSDLLTRLAGLFK